MSALGLIKSGVSHWSMAKPADAGGSARTVRPASPARPSVASARCEYVL